ncbi:MAG: ComF family protein [Candidatus Omnitrophica bacterium]|nr:ComF family protein [Candidatus Omnitrophota bacterium]
MLRRFINSLVDIVYPKICLACKNKLREQSCIENIVCAECWGKIKKNLPPFCHSCGRHLEKFVSKICPSCLRKQLHFDRAFSPCVYEGVIKKLIHAFKYQNKDYLGFKLSRLMIEFIKEYNVPVDLLDSILPIPLHKTRLREREFNQAEVLSNHIAKEFNKTVLSDCLMRHRYTKTQTGLKDSLRLLNVKGSFSTNQGKAIKGKNILLVDDVLTTGSTASEAAYVLKNAGANIVFVLTLAS